MTPQQRIRNLCHQIYDPQQGGEVAARILARLPSASSDDKRRPPHRCDAILITYPDSLRSPQETPLATLRRFIDRHLPEISHVHLLPFFPSSSDDGFAVIDFRQVDPHVGTWADVTAFTGRSRLMVDLVLNHTSSQSDWFEKFLAGEDGYQSWFHRVPPGVDLSRVFRPRTHPLLTTFQTLDGPANVWTTFSADQADLNYSHPPVLEEMISVLLSYVQRGATVIRLDAVGYLWKEPGTSCLHHPKTHLVVKLLRAVLDYAAPQVALVAETNVPHVDNVAYFGDGNDEAQMIYNFSLPPLVLDAFGRGDTTALTAWASTLDQPEGGSFINILASHDGIGITPASGLISEAAISRLADQIERAGGLWSGRTSADGTITPYELNIGYMDALGPSGNEAVPRFLAAVSIQLGLRGVPAVFIHSALGSSSWWQGPTLTGQARSINRKKLVAAEVESELEATNSVRSRVLSGHRTMLAARRTLDSFDPSGEQTVQVLHPSVFSSVRAHGNDAVWCLTNVTGEWVTVQPPSGWAGVRKCVLSGVVEEGAAHLEPFGYRWFRA